MRDYFGEYIRRNRFNGLQRAPRSPIGESEAPSNTKLHILWGLSLVVTCLAVWKLSKTHTKVVEAMRVYKKTGSRG